MSARAEVLRRIADLEAGLAEAHRELADLEEEQQARRRRPRAQSPVRVDELAVARAKKHLEEEHPELLRKR